MAITYGELKKRILLKIDEYEADVPEMTEDEDILTRMPDVVNESIRFVFYGKGHNKTWNVEQGGSFNAIEDEKLHGEHRTADVTFEADGAFSYFFDVDDTASVFIETFEDNDWITVKELTHTNEQPFSEFVHIKGFIGDGLTPKKARIRFSGSYYYRFRNVCLYNVAFASEDKIPDYTGYMQHDIPKNLYQIVEAYTVKDGERKNVSYYTEDYKLYLPNVEGVIYLVSKFFPDPVTAETPDDYVIDIPIDTEYIVCNKAAAIFMMEGEYAEFVADEEQGMQMLEDDRGKSGAPKVVRLV